MGGAVWSAEALGLRRSGRTWAHFGSYTGAVWKPRGCSLASRRSEVANSGTILWVDRRGGGRAHDRPVASEFALVVGVGPIREGTEFPLATGRSPVTSLSWGSSSRSGAGSGRPAWVGSAIRLPLPDPARSRLTRPARSATAPPSTARGSLRSPLAPALPSVGPPRSLRSRGYGTTPTQIVPPSLSRYVPCSGYCTDRLSPSKPGTHTKMGPDLPPLVVFNYMVNMGKKIPPIVHIDASGDRDGVRDGVGLEVELGFGIGFGFGFGIAPGGGNRPPTLPLPDPARSLFRLRLFRSATTGGGRARDRDRDRDWDWDSPTAG